MRGQHCPEQPEKQESKYLFSISINFKNDLEENNISDDLRKAFEDNNYPLSDNVKISILSSMEWNLSDSGKKYTIKESGNQLNIYKTKKSEPEETQQWETLLINTEIMVESRDKAIPTVGGILLFGENPNRYLPQAGISAVAYYGKEKDYEAIERETIRGPIVAKITGEDIVDTGLVERAIEFVRRNTGSSTHLTEGRRIDKPVYPEEVIRETIVNAIAHRDYTISGTDIELSIYSDRLEVISPGKLPNTVTIERMKAGCRATRNELIKEVLRDYHYVEATGLGVPRKIIAGMLKHNGTEPDLIEDEYSFTVRLWKQKSGEG